MLSRLQLCLWEGKPAMMSKDDVSSRVQTGGSQMHQPQEKAIKNESERRTWSFQRVHINAWRGLQLQWVWCTDAREQCGRYQGTSISTCKNLQEIQKEAKKRTPMYRGITVSLKVISVLSLWSRIEVISSHLSIFPPFLVHLKQLKFYIKHLLCARYKKISFSECVWSTYYVPSILMGSGIVGNIISLVLGPSEIGEKLQYI